MTTEEIMDYVNSAIDANFAEVTKEAGEMTTSEGGDGRFFGKVQAVRYSGLANLQALFLVVGETEKKVQIIKFGNTEALTPSEGDLDLILQKELGLA